MALDRDRVLELLQMLKDSTAGEIAVQEGDRYYRLTRLVVAPAVSGATAPSGAAIEPGGPLASGPAPDDGKVTVQSRVVGLFYRGKTPGGEPLVEVGQQVQEGQLLGVVEVLRKPTEVLSPAAGELLEIIPKDGDGVQYGDPLFVIRP